MTKSKLYDSLIIIFFYIGISCLPFSLLNVSSIFILIFQILSQFVIFFIIKLVLKKSPLKLKERTPVKENILYFFPAFIACFSNFFTLLNPSYSIEPSFSFNLLLGIALSLFIAFNEEYIFRMIMIDNLEASEKPIIKIIIASSVFSACHLTHFFSSFNPFDLIIVVYTYGIGIILGLIYVYTESFMMCVIFHFLYNSINNNLASWIKLSNDMLPYYLINTAIGIIVGAYLLVLYLLKFSKCSKKQIPNSKQE